MTTAVDTRKSLDRTADNESDHGTSFENGSDNLNTKDDPKCTLIINNLTRTVTEGHIREIASCYGDVLNVNFKLTGLKPSSRKCEVVFKNTKDAENAHSHLDQGQIDGQTITTQIMEILLTSNLHKGMHENIKRLESSSLSPNNTNKRRSPPVTRHNDKTHTDDHYYHHASSDNNRPHRRKDHNPAITERRYPSSHRKVSTERTLPIKERDRERRDERSLSQKRRRRRSPSIRSSSPNKPTADKHKRRRSISSRSSFSRSSASSSWSSRSKSPSGSSKSSRGDYRRRRTNIRKPR